MRWQWALGWAPDGLSKQVERFFGSSWALGFVGIGCHWREDWGRGPLQVGKGPGGSRPLWRVESWLLHPVGIE